MSAAIVTVAVDTTTQRLLLVLAAVLIGACVGLVGALIFGAVRGVRATPNRTQAVLMSTLPPLPTRSVPEPRAEPDPHAPSPFAATGIGTVPVLYAVDSDVVRDRHRELYDAEYVKHLDHVDALRRRIETRLALSGERHQPSEEPDPTEELDA
ncbi:MAG: hypothetical protein ACXVVU_13250 [Solirubrobacteraceae bacterium]